MLSGPQNSALAANIILPILAVTAVALRLVVQNRTKNRIGVAEYVMLLALVLAVGVCALGIYGSIDGLIGVTLNTISLAQFQNYLLIIFIDILVCHLVYGLIKISILLFYKRIFPTPKFQAHANVLLGVVTAFTIAVTLVQIFGTVPIEAAWKVQKYGKGNFLYDHQVFLVCAAAIDMTLDLWTLALPLRVISSLHLERQRKIGLSLVFLLGFFCIVASAVRLYYVVELLYVYSMTPERARGTAFRIFLRIPLTVLDVANANDIWAHIESCASIVTACLPTLAPLYRNIPLARYAGRVVESWVVSIESFLRSSWSKRTEKEGSTENLTQV